MRASLLISLSGAQTDELRVCIDAALCPALPQSWQQRVFFFFFFFSVLSATFSDTLSGVLWKGRRGRSRYDGIIYLSLTTLMVTGTVRRTWPWPTCDPFIITCHHCPGAAQSPGTSRGAHAVVGILFKLSLQQSRLRSEREPKRSHPSYLFNDVQSKALNYYRSLIIHVDTITYISSAFYLLLMKRSGWTCRSVKSNN